MIKNWIVISNRFTFEFENAHDPGITIKIVARSEEEAWRKLEKSN